MSAINMAGDLTVPANPSDGKTVLMDPFSGPTGSPFDNDQTGNNSTGCLCTGIGFGCANIINPGQIEPQFNDDYVPGITLPDGTSATTAILTTIGGGKSDANVGGEAVESPYVAQPLLNFGGGGSRDAGVGPAFTGFSTKTVTAVGTVIDGGVVETGFVNRSGETIVVSESVFGSSTAASPAVT